ncbi:MAG: hypothetical protein JWQ62_2007 [Lacunisphaera sp.]|nr:hypothetical protein [Lacunisphaera sp.]
MNHRILSPAKLVFLGVLALVVAANHAFFFTIPWHENGDFAVNALQVERAKHLDEFLGNYSRFHFNHPGPAFFYVYAAGEYLFYDWLQIVPSPHNAHALAGLLLQTMFFSAALGVAAGWVRSPWFLPLALLAASAHFSLAGNAFTSIWPPHVLLMPFLCLLTAGASVATGRVRHLPLAVLAGCFLVHGHVAQALFVLLLFVLLYGIFLCGLRTPGESLIARILRPQKLVAAAVPISSADDAPGALSPLVGHRFSHLLATACIGLFLLPLMVDLASGSESNLVAIARFMLARGDPAKSFAQAGAYLLSFFAYFHNQDDFLPALGPGDPGFVWTRAVWYLPWLAIIAFVVFMLFRKKFQEHAAPERRFLQCLAGLAAAGFVLTIPWGIIQTGPMFEFNGHFYYALLYALLLLFAAGLARLLPERGAGFAGVLCCAGAAMIFWRGTRPPESTMGADYAWFAATEAVLQADPHQQTTKFFVFDHDNWGDVARTALALKRLGGSYRVDGNWSFMFGRFRSFQPAPPAFDLGGMSVWRFSRHELPAPHVTLAGDLKVYFEPFPLDPAAATIDCSLNGNLEQFALFGFTTPDNDYSWTNLPHAALQFRSPPAARDILVSITAEPFVRMRHITSQPMELTVNGRKVASYDINRPQTVTARVPADIWNLRPIVTIVLSLPGARSPLQLGISRDPRVLGWGVRQVTFKLAN